MGGYDNAKLVLHLEDASLGARFLVAQVLTAIVGTVTYPIDTVRRKLMMMVTACYLRMTDDSSRRRRRAEARDTKELFIA